MKDKLKNLISHFRTFTILSIDLSQDKTKAVVVKRQGKKTSILAIAEVDSLAKDGIGKLLNKLKYYPKDVVVVSNKVKLLASELPIPTYVKLSSDKMCEAVHWEAEPYFDFSVSEGIFKYQLSTNKVSLSKDDSTTPVLISAMSRKDYAQLSNDYRKHNLNLRSAYAKENAFAFATTNSSVKNENRIILKLEQDSAMGIFVNNKGSVIFQHSSIDTVERLVSELVANTEELREIIIIDGENLPESDTLIVHKEFIKGLIGRLENSFQIPVRRWDFREDLKDCQLMNKSIYINSQYTSAIGAAFQELEISGHSVLGVNDRLNLHQILKSKTDLLPIFLAGLLVFTFLTHYFYCKFSLFHYSSSVRRLQAEKNRLQAPFVSAKAAKIKLEEVKKEIIKIAEKKEYIQEILPLRHKTLFSFLQGLSERIPDEVILSKISQETTDMFLLEGQSVSANSVMLFVERLENLKATREVGIISINEKKDNKEEDLFLYSFVISVILNRG